MLPGTYTVPLDVQVSTANPLKIVATGAVLVPSGSSAAIVVSAGASVDIRGVTIVSTQAVKCGAPTAPASALLIRDASMTATSTAAVIDLTRCALQIFGSEMNLASSEIALLAGDDVVVKADRVRIYGNSSHHIFASGSKRVVMEFTNSLLEDVGLDVNTSDTAAPGSHFSFAAATFVFLTNTSLSLGCDEPSSAHRSVRYENNIVAPLGAFDAVNGPNCMFVNTLLARQAVPPPGTIVGDPQFVAANGRDFHLKGTSPAIDVAVPSSVGPDFVRDLDGTTRPQGVKQDLGAYEFAVP